MPSDNPSTEDGQAREGLKNLLHFTAELLARPGSVVFDISEYPIHLTARDLLGEDGTPLPGITFAPSDDAASEDVWLSFARLQERRPPPPPDDLRAWLRSEAHPDPSNEPSLLAERIVEVTPDEATELIDAGFADADAVYQVDGKPGQGDPWAVPLRPAELPAVAAVLDAYTEGSWRAWAASEAPRRKAIGIYERLFQAHAQIAAAGGEGGLELVVGMGLAHWQYNGRRINVPLIEQRAEFELEQSDGTLAILPRNVPPAPALAAFSELGISAAAALQREMATRLEEIAKDPDLVLRPSDPSSFQSVLATCAARLDASGVVLAPDDELGSAGQGLRISPTFCVIVRPRREDILRDDIRRLADGLLNDTVPLPETARRFVTPLSDKLPGAIISPRGVGPPGDSWNNSGGGSAGASSRERILFPLPANEEQEEIIRRLEQPDVYGVVVQGPPGTGKTHTIANIIGHSMATGRRVLVSAHTAEALTAIREKLPKALGDLAIAVTHSDREGARQLEEAVSVLAARVLAINTRAAERRADDLLRRIDQADTRTAAIDAELADIARANLTEIPWRGANLLPQAIAAWTAAQGDRHDWFRDRLDITAHYEPCFGDPEIDAARRLRRHLGEDVCYRADNLPSGSAAFPGLGAVVAAHQALRAAAEKAVAERDGALPLPDLAAAAPGELADLLDWLERLAAWRDGCPYHPWMPAAWEALAGGSSPGGIPPALLLSLLKEAARLTRQGEELALLAPELAEIAEADRLAAALDRLSKGRKPFGVFGRFGRSPVRDAIDAARIAGVSPRDAAGWSKLVKLHAWREETHEFAARWNAFARAHGLTLFPEDRAAAREALPRLGQPAEEMLILVIEAQARLARLRVLFPYGVQAEAVVLRIDVVLAVAVLRANLGEAERAAAMRLSEELRARAHEVGGTFGEALLQTAEGLGAPDIDDAAVATQWQDIQAEADRLAGLQDDLRWLFALAERVRASGAERWADRIAREPPGADDIVLPSDWRDAWDYARARGFLARVADRARTEALTRERAELTKARERHFLDVIELRTYLGLRGRLTDNVQAALRGYLAALAKLPKTAGAKTGVRMRRILRDSMRTAAKAIPCWIMPEWRVSEQLPAELGGFDLVIIDEASQSNIMALPVVLRGQKLLIVGDDKQVSPTVFVAQAVVDRLRDIYLKGQPLANHIDPATSLYELGGMMYPDTAVLLREHFRCVEPIIRFSSRFYPGGLLPLRLPKPSERLDPPLVDILVEDGRRRDHVNEAEAAIVVEEIKRTIADAAVNAAGKRSIGVIALHRDKQPHLIYNHLIQAIGPKAIDEHRILCGDSATFQGQERDIVFLSMVHDAESAKKQTTRPYEQRYNVALSRARDRMVLVRSVTSSMLKEGDIKLEVLRHFQDP
ncbi:MAG: AAA domain-containing protein, partial [Acetobacteraceae bacterium]